MSKGKVPKDALQAINKKINKPITENQIKNVASTVTPETMQSEAQLRQLIKQVAMMANVPVTESTVNEIISTVKKSGINGGSLESLMKLMTKK
ncbi:MULTISPECIES: stage VI sporulation protein F [Paenibacillus]|uniref:Stage VI sporulation protein F n=1 Tax=Paenibacillus arenosi TaxID=2774142 RepID=A0ABR9AU43_9BACL|nr:MULTISPECIES: stage VI sporulation protein F [Paenibacillus]MBD8497641.1 stage VI sporulation protein F [Paenibacillus arenosi]